MFRKLFLPLLLFTSLQISAQSFNFRHFDVPGAAATEPDNINGQGDIDGFFFDHAGVQHGFLFRQGTFTQLDFPGATSTKTAGLNDRDDIVGTFADASGVQHGLVLENGVYSKLDFPAQPPLNWKPSTTRERLSAFSLIRLGARMGSRSLPAHSRR